MIEYADELGIPAAKGLYVAYVNDDCNMPTAKRILLMYVDRWCYPLSDQNYRGHVYGWVGPLPIMKLED